MKLNEVIKISKKEALKIVRSDRRKIVHCFMSFCGADWKKKSVVETIQNGEDWAWTGNIFGHELAVLEGGRVHHFDYHRP